MRSLRAFQKIGARATSPGERLLSHAKRHISGVESCNGIKPEPPVGQLLAPRRSIPPRPLASDEINFIPLSPSDVREATPATGEKRYLASFTQLFSTSLMTIHEIGYQGARGHRPRAVLLSARFHF